MNSAPTPRRPPGRTPVRFERLIKPSGGIRLISRLDPADLKRFERIVAGLGPRIETALGPSVRANRLSGRGSQLRPFGPARTAWAEGIDEKLRARPRSVVVTDVRDCYGSIRVPFLAATIRRIGGEERLVLELVELLEHLQGEGVRGLPIGPEPSAVLANLVLADADQALRELGTPFERWVDDFVICADGRRGSIRALDALRRVLGESGLEVSEPKTEIMDAHDAKARLVAGETPTPASGVA